MIKSTIFTLLIPAILMSQSLYWADFTFQQPRLCTASTNGADVSSVDLTAGTTPQGIVYDSETNHLYLVELYYPNASIMQGDYSLSVNTVASGYSVLRDIDIDPINNKLFWTSSKAGANTIRSSNLDGSSPQTLRDFTHTDPGLRSIALDADNGMMYWTEFSANRLRGGAIVGDATGTIVDNLDGPVGLAIDMSTHKLYWTEINGNTIKRCHVDGTNIETLIDTGLDRPNHITLDPENNIMYWTEDGNSGSSIKSATLDGNNVQTILSDIGHPAGIAFSPTSALLVRLKLFLQGYYQPATDQMHKQLHDSGVLPTTSPYADNRTVNPIPANVSDWVYLKLKSSATGSDIAERSAFLHQDGSIVDDDGTSDVTVEAAPGDYYLVVEQRNHLGVMSSSAHPLTAQQSSTTLYDFSNQLSRAYGSKGVLELETGIWGLAAGDFDQDGLITTTDYVIWYNAIQDGTENYTPSDVDGNTVVNPNDFKLWQNNSMQKIESGIP